MFIGIGTDICSGGSIVGTSLNVPSFSHEFIDVNSETLSMSDADFGAFDYAKFAYSYWQKSGDGYTNGEYVLGKFQLFSTSPFVRNVVSTVDFKSGDGGFRGTTDVITDKAWHHILIHFDSANPAAADRIKVWIDGIAETPTSYTAPLGAAADVVAPFVYGNRATAGGQFFDGKLYQPSFFSGYLPDISEVYNAGSPMDVTGITGLHSSLDPDTSVTSDVVLASDWTDTNTVNLSADIPT